MTTTAVAEYGDSEEQWRQRMANALAERRRRMLRSRTTREAFQAARAAGLSARRAAKAARCGGGAR